MAERSTAAVDVADNSGDKPLAAQAAQATSDGVDTQNGRAADGPMPDKDGEGKNAAPAAAPELHSGTSSPGATGWKSASPVWTDSAAGAPWTRSCAGPWAST